MFTCRRQHHLAPVTSCSLSAQDFLVVYLNFSEPFSFHCPPGSLSSCPSSLVLPLDTPLPLPLGGGYPVLLSTLSTRQQAHVGLSVNESPNLLSFSYFHSSDSPWCLEPKRSPWLFPSPLSTGLVASEAAWSFQPSCLDCCLTLSYLGGRHALLSAGG